MEQGTRISQAKEVNQNRLRLMQGCTETERSPEIGGKAQSAAVGGTENHILCTYLGKPQLSPAFGKGVTTDSLFWERIHMNLWCTAWERRMVTAPLEARGLFTGAMKNAVGPDKRTTSP